MASSTSHVKAAAIYIPIAVVTYVVMLALIIVMHEFTHSTWAWALGYVPKPFDIVWGNPLTIKGWDEGVPYRQLFPTPGNPAESVIGGSPLALHTTIVVAGLLLLQRQWMATNKWLYHFVYWFVVVSLGELVAYILMRPFMPGGDTGHFNHGLGISPWILFAVGGLFVIAALYVFFKRILPIMDEVVARDNRLTQWAVLLITAFAIFLWGSGFRFLFLYPDSQWLFGLLGIAAFAAVVFACRPKAASLEGASSGVR